MYTGFDHARERFSLFKKKDHPSVLSTGERLALTLRPQVGEGKGDLVLFSGFAFIFDLKGVSKFGVKIFRGVIARQDKKFEMGNLGPLTPNKGARRHQSLRREDRPTNQLVLRQPRWRSPGRLIL